MGVCCAESKAPGGLALGTFPNLFGPSMSGFQSHPQSPSVYMKMPVCPLSHHLHVPVVCSALIVFLIYLHSAYLLA